ncbi:MAG: PTS lactose/cellobiose transporter subunit IIA [Tissierellia bacterium]|nr:PTS lactose/cellobiose transporter subunit IIA [Tissierellia bacterium]
MNKKDVAMIGFEIVAFSGDARSKLLEALKLAKQKDFEGADQLVKKANECLVDAHNSQTEMLTLESRGEDVELGFIMVHAQDHLMTTLLLKDLIYTLMDIYKDKE